MTENNDFLPIGVEQQLEATPSPFHAIAWLVFVILLVTAPAVVIAAWLALL